MGRVDMLCLLCRRTYTNTWSQADQVAQDFCELHIVALFLRHVFSCQCLDLQVVTLLSRVDDVPVLVSTSKSFGTMTMRAVPEARSLHPTCHTR